MLDVDVNGNLQVVAVFKDLIFKLKRMNKVVISNLSVKNLKNEIFNLVLVNTHNVIALSKATSQLI